jgi:DNA-binding Xre family transcriptional regulator
MPVAACEAPAPPADDASCSRERWGVESLVSDVRFHADMTYRMERYSPTELDALAQIGGAIRVARLRIPWSQHALARRCGISQSTISRLEAGKAPTVRVARLAWILIVLRARLVIELIPPELPPRGAD